MYINFENNGSTSTSKIVDVQSNKEVTITENGSIEITPDVGNVAMEKVTATVDVSVPKSDKYFLWFYEGYPSPSETIDWSYLFSSKWISHNSFAASYYIKGVSSVDDIEDNQEIDVFPFGLPETSKLTYTATVSGQKIVLTYESYSLALSRSDSVVSWASEALSAFARFDGVTSLCVYEENTYAVNGSYCVESTNSDGVGKIYVNVPPSIAEISHVFVKSANNLTVDTPISFDVSAGTGGKLYFDVSYNLASSDMANSNSGNTRVIEVSDLLSEDQEITLHKSGPGTDAYKVVANVSVTGSGYPYQFSITPTYVGSSIASTDYLIVARIN